MLSDRVWCAVSALDVYSAALTVGGPWPIVLRPASVAQRLAPGGPTPGAYGVPEADAASAGRGELLCSSAIRFADAASVRSVHWFLGPRGTVIAETAWGDSSSAVLVGWAPHVHEGRPANDRTPLPGALLLGVFATADAARRLAELVPQTTLGDTAVVGRWALPQGCAPMSVRSVVHPGPGVLRRELVTQLTEAFVRVQEDGQERAQDPAR